jgi:hypothetical protein
MKSNEGHTGGVDVMLFCTNKKCRYIENYAEHEEKDDDFQLERVVSDALVAAIDAFWKKLDSDGWDLMLQYEFRASLLDNIEYKTILKTVRMDNIERPAHTEQRRSEENVKP